MLNPKQASVNAFVGTVIDLRRLLLGGGEGAAPAACMHWKAHSMGCHLMLGLVERAHWAKEPLASLFARVTRQHTQRSHLFFLCLC